MTLFINIVITFAVLSWPLVWVSSVMMAGGPGASNNASLIRSSIMFVSYPQFIFLILAALNIPFWGVNSLYCAAISAVLVYFTQIPNFKLLSNLKKGIANSGYSIAGDIAYFNGKPIESADAASFHILEGDFLASRANYAWDDTALYYDGKVIEGARPSKLKPIFSGHGEFYVSSDDHVMYSGLVLQDCQPNGFRLPEHSYGGWAICDQGETSFVYFYSQKVEGADGRSFVPLGSYIGKDDSHFYCQDAVLETDADPATFNLFREFCRYGRDSQSVYFVDSKLLKIESADIETFEEVHINTPIHSDARDAHHLYLDGKRVGKRDDLSETNDKCLVD